MNGRNIMLPLLTVLFLTIPLVGQVKIETIAGRGIRSGVSVSESGAFGGEFTYDRSGNLVWADRQNHVIWRRRGGRGGSVVEAIAGTGVRGYSGDGGPAAQAKLNFPEDPQFDAAGNLYFSDANNFRIRRVDTSGVITTVAGNGVRFVLGMELEGRAAEHSIDLRSVGRMVVDLSGNIYLGGDGFGSSTVIRRVDSAGELKVFAGMFDAGCSACSDGDGGLATRAHVGPLSWLAVNAAGVVYLTDRGLGGVFNIRRVTADGVISRFAGASVCQTAPNGVIDTEGILYLKCSAGTGPTGGDYTIRISADGATQEATKPSKGQQFLLDAAGRVAYLEGTEIRSLQDDSLVDTFVVDPYAASPDGTAAKDALLGQVTFIAVSHAGEVYLSDNLRCRIRKIDGAGTLRTVAGSGTCEPGGFPGVASMVFDQQDRLWVRGQGRTFILARDGTFTEEPLRRDLGVEPNIAVDEKNRLYVMGADYLNQLETDGTVLPIVRPQRYEGPPPPAAGIFNPRAIGTDAEGRVYFAANLPKAIYRIEDDGQVTRVLDSGSFSGSRLSVDRFGRFWVGGLLMDSFGTREVLNGGQTALAPNGDFYMLQQNAGARIERVSGLANFSRAAPVIDTNGIRNSASNAGGAISPGELVSIYGRNFGFGGLVVPALENNRYPFELGLTRVLFNGQPGYITAATPTQINVFVPNTIETSGEVSVVVQVDDLGYTPVRVPLAPMAFGLYSLNGTGTGPGAILNQDGTVNSALNPAARGSIVSVFGTGEGVTTPQIDSGALVLSKPYPTSEHVFRMRIDGQAAEVMYAGAAPFLPTGVFQINVKVPLTVSSGAVGIGEDTGAAAVTVAIH